MTALADAYDRWIRAFHESAEDGVRLICLPAAGESANSFFALSSALPPSVATRCVQYPGRQDRGDERTTADVHGLAADLLQALEGHLDWPYALFGHGMGAAVAFELARLLERGAGPDPTALLVSGRRAPAVLRDERARSEGGGAEPEPLLPAGGDAVFIKGPEQGDAVLSALRAEHRAAETYRCEAGAAVRCPLTVLVGDRDPGTTIEQARAWRRHTTGEFDLRILPGERLVLQECATEVVNIISDVLLYVRPPADDGGSAGG
ncbi:alpha/beta fold hydrolase [Streptomyces sp. NPDC021969]|uniref:thioesterase II family protein n=1 Tax=unclassified Streptomyces TaxID=2593676 RepID=UPI0033C319BF